MERLLVHAKQATEDAGIVHLRLDAMDAGRIRELRDLVGNARERGLASPVVPTEGDVSIRIAPDVRLGQILGDLAEISEVPEAQAQPSSRTVIDTQPL